MQVGQFLRCYWNEVVSQLFTVLVCVCVLISFNIKKTNKKPQIQLVKDEQ